MKEIKLSPTIQKNDILHKSRNVEKFLKENEQVKLTVKLVGRQINFPDEGVKVLKNVLALFPDVAVIKDITKEPNGKSIYAVIRMKK